MFYPGNQDLIPVNSAASALPPSSWEGWREFCKKSTILAVGHLLGMCSSVFPRPTHHPGLDRCALLGLRHVSRHVSAGLLGTSKTCHQEKNEAIRLWQPKTSILPAPGPPSMPIPPSVLTEGKAVKNQAVSLSSAEPATIITSLDLCPCSCL